MTKTMTAPTTSPTAEKPDVDLQTADLIDTLRRISAHLSHDDRLFHLCKRRDELRQDFAFNERYFRSTKNELAAYEALVADLEAEAKL